MVLTLIGPAKAEPPSMTAREVTKSITTMGPRGALDSLYQNEDQWNKLIAGIATGKPAWLNIAKRLRRVSDGGTREQIDLAVGEALEHRPADVLSLVLDEFGLDEVCQGPDVDDKRFDSYDLAIAAIRHRQDKLRALNNGNLTVKRDACVSALDRARADIARFYNHGS